MLQVKFHTNKLHKVFVRQDAVSLIFAKYPEGVIFNSLTDITILNNTTPHNVFKKNKVVTEAAKKTFHRETVQCNI